MKKIVFLLMMLVLLSIGAVCHANTYEVILEENGYTDIHTNYLNRAQLKGALSVIFKKEFAFNAEGYGNSTGADFFAMVEDELGLFKNLGAERKAYLNRALSFAGLCDLLDYYFDEISKLHNLESFYGKVSVSESGYTLTYGAGKVEKFSDFKFFTLKEKLCDVIVITRDKEVIDVCPVDLNVPLSGMYDKKEMAGRIYLLYDKGIIIESGGELYSFPIASSFRIFRDGDGEDVVLILGSYRKNKNVAALAIGRNE